MTNILKFFEEKNLNKEEERIMVFFKVLPKTRFFSVKELSTILCFIKDGAFHDKNGQPLIVLIP